jgi:hypothetical protein
MKFVQQVKQWLRPLIDQATLASAAYLESKEHIIQQSVELINFQGAPKNQSDERLMEILKFLTIYEVPDKSLIRIGGPNDGGYVMYRPESKSTAISLGVGPNVSWDQNMVLLGHRVEMFDPTIKRPPNKVSGANFHRLGVVGNLEDQPNVDLRSIAELREFCKSDDKDLILKIDVEGAEWSAFANTTSAELEHYTQILVEFHDLHKISNDTQFELMKKAITNLCTTHFAVHLHANNYSRLVRFGRYWFPDAIEVSFIRKSDASLARIRSVVASEFDNPNCSELSEFNLEGLLEVWKR